MEAILQASDSTLSKKLDGQKNQKEFNHRSLLTWQRTFKKWWRPTSKIISRPLPIHTFVNPG